MNATTAVMRAMAFSVHILTASGAALALLALIVALFLRPREAEIRAGVT